jgi:hypothetical protein
MPDNLKRRSGLDRTRIDIGQEHEVRYWTDAFNVSREQLVEAVHAVGDNVEAVKQYLRTQPQRDE